MFMRAKTDCLRSCLATVLEVDYDVVPDFSAHKNWVHELRAWLLMITGHDMIIVVPSDYQVQEHDLLIGVGPSPRIKNKDHAVVIDSSMDVVHDPSPEGTPISSISYIIVIRRASDL